MSTNVKLILDKRRQKEDKTFPLCLRIIHSRKSTSIPLGYSFALNDWNEKTSIVKSTYKGVSNVTRLNKWIQKQKIQALDIINTLEDSGEISQLSVVELKNRIVRKTSEETFFQFTENVIEEMNSAGRIGYAQSIHSVLRLVRKFRKERDFTFKELNYSFLVRFESYCLGRGNTLNSIAVYMKTIKMIYNRAIKSGIVSRELYPFVNYTIKTTKTRKRAVPREVIRSIETLTLESGTQLWHARNYFLFSFYTMGMNFADIAFLKPSNIVGDRLVYTRRKTKKEYSLKISSKIEDILNLYLDGKSGGEYIFPIITRKGIAEFEYKDMAGRRRNYNKKLKEIAALCEIDANLTSYVARHTWATVAKHNGVPVAVISEGMGHSDTKITEVYLDSFGKEVLDDYNEMITK